MPEEEEQKETEAFEKVRPISDFYKKFGGALAMPTPKTLPMRWKGPDCILDVTLDGSELTATGTFERSLGLLGLAILDTTRKPAAARFRIEYKGTAHGRAIVATVVREKEGEQAKTSTLLGLQIEDRLTTLMLLSEDGQEIIVCEKPKTDSPRFYSLRPC